MKALINKSFNSIFRAADMLCLNIGDNIKTTVNGKKCAVPEFSLHIQTQWRFVKEGEILLASRDIYEPYCENAANDWDYDVLGRPKEEGSIFDALCEEINGLLENCVIIDCKVSLLGDLKILFYDGIYFETFTPTSRKEEVWRLLDYATGEHTVVFDEE